MKLFARSPAAAIVVCLVGGLLVFLTSGRVWARATAPNVTGGDGSATLSVTGHQVAASIPATGIALMALALAILAASGMMRRLVGGVTVLLGVAAVGVAIAARGNVSKALEDREVGATGLAVHASANGWWVVTLVGGLLALAAGLLAIRYAPAWSGMAERYDAPGATQPKRDPAAVAWDALDRGEDPTA
ncbi:MAG: Trp biosynthesis-associated membrane protein [Solirubrobacterales bacterium]|nr:Trp biosynthesis-associated membrane protein [Frankiaceae bacterium]MBV9604142.1 Trp biosynthesis-associated membrane protein [Solirubrobacterales bacterium]MBV9869829.1 Trp biosynthesis-associated membrane protein [Frankiaceae bacterium]